MKKQEFLKEVMESTRFIGTGLTKGQCAVALEAIIMTVKDELKTDAMECKVPGLGTFRLVTRKARSGRNPQTGEAMEIPEKMVVKFKAAKGF